MKLINIQPVTLLQPVFIHPWLKNIFRDISIFCALESRVYFPDPL